MAPLVFMYENVKYDMVVKRFFIEFEIIESKFINDNLIEFYIIKRLNLFNHLYYWITYIIESPILSNHLYYRITSNIELGYDRLGTDNSVPKPKKLMR